MELSTKDMEVIPHESSEIGYGNLYPEMSFDEFHDAIDVTCESIKIFKRIQKVCDKNGFFNYIIIFDEVNIAAINIKPLETIKEKRMSDKKIIEKWTRFANDL